MERSDFLKRINNRALLQDDVEGLEKVCDAHPYSSLVQLLNFQAKKKVSQEEVKKISLFFENPLHLNHVIKDLKPDLPKETKERGLKEESDVVGELTEEVEDKTETLEKVSAVSKEDHATKDVNKEEMEEEVAKEVREVKEENDEKDILELINELPEENPIKLKTESVTTESKDTETGETSQSAIAEDPQHLMVMMSFTDWLQYYKSKNESEAEDQRGRDAIRSAWQKEKLAEAMDDEEDVVPDAIFEKAMKSVSFGDGLVTESLAEIYVKQGKTDQAIELYKKLSLLNPEKRTYFASKIKNLHL